MSGHDDEQLIGEYPYLPKQKRALEKRHALLESGRLLFIEKGYEQTNAKEIASHAGVAVGTFYRYFTDKRQLLMSLLEDQIENFLPPEPNWAIVDPETFFANVMEQHFLHLDRLGLHRVLPELMLKDPQLAEVVTDARNKVHHRILTDLQKARAKGLIWDDLDLNIVSWSIMTLSEKLPDRLSKSNNQVNYYELSKVICRLVFPPAK
ncbi:TetR/AcrR family transcriptional regulator [Metabacillus malikii]|uniref:AcrR family transcriptional regulator n=1 Tax=Metabacillus malikii TaxID=1504265 RepID=A0ABT9ZC69_9BACI|nr:TetR/AcrR family transcriptional regulator [Metabacillus malikii]MDQ0229846.1 AcrR family transcriptional regulator [Metabacillus malikii]